MDMRKNTDGSRQKRVPSLNSCPSLVLHLPSVYRRLQYLFNFSVFPSSRTHLKPPPVFDVPFMQNQMLLYGTPEAALASRMLPYSATSSPSRLYRMAVNSSHKTLYLWNGKCPIMFVYCLQQFLCFRQKYGSRDA